MAERPLMPLATKEEVLSVFRKNAQEVLEGRRGRVRLTQQGLGFERSLLWPWISKTKPQMIVVAEGPRQVTRELREAALEALQAELGMGKVVFREEQSGDTGFFNLQRVVSRVTSETAIPSVFFVQTTSWWRNRERAIGVSWDLVRTDTTILSRSWCRLMGQQPLFKARRSCPSYG